MRKTYFSLAVLSILLTACGSSSGNNTETVSTAAFSFSGTKWAKQLETASGAPCTYSVNFLTGESVGVAITCNYGTYLRVEEISARVSILDSKITFTEVENLCADSALSTIVAGTSASYSVSGANLNVTTGDGNVVFTRNGELQPDDLPVERGCLLDPVAPNQDNWQLL